MHQPAMAVPQDLDLDMARRSHVSLKEDSVVAETVECFALRSSNRVDERLGGLNHTHALAAATSRCLNQ